MVESDALSSLTVPVMTDQEFSRGEQPAVDSLLTLNKFFSGADGEWTGQQLNWSWLQ
uniref:Uncharacterized protein n=1 Tax=Anguilla anguilla TaxID=7936 RepID=A0A0E9WM81_ANGAN